MEMGISVAEYLLIRLKELGANVVGDARPVVAERNADALGGASHCDVNPP